jgi:small subunit ribosomal protein S20
MANTSSAKKAAKQSVLREERNLARKTAIKTAIKKVLAALSTDANQAQELLKDVAAQLSRAKSKRMIHANTASRKLSRLAQKVAQATRA